MTAFRVVRRGRGGIIRASRSLRGFSVTITKHPFSASRSALVSTTKQLAGASFLEQKCHNEEPGCPSLSAKEFWNAMLLCVLIVMARLIVLTISFPMLIVRTTTQITLLRRVLTATLLPVTTFLTACKPSVSTSERSAISENGRENSSIGIAIASFVKSLLLKATRTQLTLFVPVAIFTDGNGKKT